jgi:hypothetical protein
LIASEEVVDDDFPRPGDLPQSRAGLPQAAIAQVRSSSSSARKKAAREISGLRVFHRSARLISLPMLPSCSARDRVHQRPAGQIPVCGVHLASHQAREELHDCVTRSRIVHAPRAIAERRTQVDHGIELDPFSGSSASSSAS